MKIIFFLSILLSSLIASPSYENGKKVYLHNGCGDCHGRNLEGLHKYPYLANRAKGYMTYKLKRFRDKISETPQQDMMIPYAINLSDEDIENLTTYMNEFVPEKNGKKYDDSFRREGTGGS